VEEEEEEEKRMRTWSFPVREEDLVLARCMPCCPYTKKKKKQINPPLHTQQTRQSKEGAHTSLIRTITRRIRKIQRQRQTRKRLRRERPVLQLPLPDLHERVHVVHRRYQVVEFDSDVVPAGVDLEVGHGGEGEVCGDLGELGRDGRVEGAGGGAEGGLGREGEGGDAGDQYCYQDGGPSEMKKFEVRIP
jgi:hypothetical protein